MSRSLLKLRPENQWELVKDQHFYLPTAEDQEIRSFAAYY
jgi:hypothetical protein